jgi:non-specific protein-tyrosine kinase
LLKEVCSKLDLDKEPDFLNVSNPIGKLRKKIEILPVRNTQLILVAVEDNNPMRAADIANTLADTYLGQDRLRCQRTAKEAVDFIKGRIAEIKQQLQASQRALSKYEWRHRWLFRRNSQEYITLKKAVESNQEMYKAALGWAEKINPLSKLEASTAGLVERAEIPSSPRRAKIAIYLILSLVGLLCGIYIVSAFELLKKRINPQT